MTNTQLHPSSKSLIKATIIAALIAGVLLITTILPAEYGVDPTGIGGALGLTELNSNDQEQAAAVMPVDASGVPALIAATTESGWRTDQQSIVLEAFDGIELKALMQKGQQIAFSWETDGAPVYVDMHAEEPAAGEDVFTTFWKEKQQTGAQGLYSAPFDGTHGWYWQNMSEETITVTLNIAGFYEKLYTP